MAVRTKNSTRTGNDVIVGYEAELWRMADALRGSMDAAEYKHVVLGLIFLKYISDAFEKPRTRLEAEKSKGADPEDPDDYRAQSIFWVPPEARWAHLKARACQSTASLLQRHPPLSPVSAQGKPVRHTRSDHSETGFPCRMATHINLYGRYEFRKQPEPVNVEEIVRELAEIRIGTEAPLAA
jgi:hypothetical protein